MVVLRMMGIQSLSNKFYYSRPLILINIFTIKMKNTKINTKNSTCKDNSNSKETCENRKIKKNGIYVCGDSSCKRVYQSYTAFYNHCKTNHDGIIPKMSKMDQEDFVGPSENRGRPRIKSSINKSNIQIHLLKNENQLIEFLGSINSQTPIIKVVKNVNIENIKWNSFFYDEFGKILLVIFKEIDSKEISIFHDPIEPYQNKIDSFNFRHIIQKIQPINVQQLFSCFIYWMSKFVCQPFLQELIYVLSFISLNFLHKLQRTEDVYNRIKYLPQMQRHLQYLNGMQYQFYYQVLKYLLSFNITQRILIQ